ncbi:MAG TPA: IPTL-CTERM sorting domain-containing protein [Saprospiraceae bacterium]|nr:IPTL-CTERM sorting domain-containing protein [Saprospiraceae bacterium]
MEKTIKILVFLGIIIGMYGYGIAQESVNSAGGDATGAGGTASYTVGQVVYTTIGDNGMTVAQGVQQAFQPEEVPIPAMSEWGILILMLLVIIFALVAMRSQGLSAARRRQIESLKVVKSIKN